MYYEIKIKLIRIAIFGDEKVGKTSICKSFLDLEFDEDEMYTIVRRKYDKKIEMDDGKELSLVIYDTPGKERFRSVAFQSCNFTKGILICFDLTNRRTLDNIKLLLDEINENYINIPILLLGNKCDMIHKRVIAKEEAIEFSNNHLLPYYETSAKNKTNIKNAILYLANIAYKKIKEIQCKTKNDSLVNKNEKENKDENEDENEDEKRNENDSLENKNKNCFSDDKNKRIQMIKLLICRNC